MRRLSRYVGLTVFYAIAVALIVFVSLDAVGAIIDEVGSLDNRYTFVEALSYVATTLPSRAYEYMPFSALIGCLVGLGVLANSSEVVVMRAAGVSLLRIVGFVLRPVMLFVLIAVAVGEYVSPYLDQLAGGGRDILLKGDLGQASNTGLWVREGNEYIHLNAVFPGGVVYGVSRYKFDGQRRIVEASFASRATYNKEEGYWFEENISSTHFYGDRTATQKQITRHWISELTPQVLQQNILTADALSIQSLYAYIAFLDQQGSSSDEYRLAFWSKLLQPLTVIGLVLIGISFVFGPLRQSTMGFRVFVGVVLAVVFRIAQDMLGPSSLVFGFEPLAAVLAPVLFCFAVGLLLLKRAG